MGAACFWRAIVRVRTSKRYLIQDLNRQELTKEGHDKPVLEQLMEQVAEEKVKREAGAHRSHMFYFDSNLRLTPPNFFRPPAPVN
jgi:hypothetical protein